MERDQLQRSGGAGAAEDIGVAPAAQDAAQCVDGGRVIVDDQDGGVLARRIEVQTFHAGIS